MGNDLYSLESLLERLDISFEKTINSVVMNSQFVTIKTGTPRVSGEKGKCIEFHFHSDGSFVGMGVYDD